MLVGQGERKLLRDVKVVPGELQHRLVVADLVKKGEKGGEKGSFQEKEGLEIERR